MHVRLRAHCNNHLDYHQIRIVPRLFHAVLLGKGDRVSADELRENLTLIDDASLFLIPLETSKDPATLLGRLFARIVP